MTGHTLTYYTKKTSEDRTEAKSHYGEKPPRGCEDASDVRVHVSTGAHRGLPVAVPFLGTRRLVVKTTLS
jgi:metal-dependent amidase/aminoacylase/carboxypeptidase family protein